MRFSKIPTVIALSALLLLSIPALADTWITYPQPAAPYTTGTTNYGGGDGSGGFITSLGPFTFSNPQSENNVPNSWATWNCPPFTESCTPNVLWNEGFITLTITNSFPGQVMGFELEPDQFQVELVTATFHSSSGDSFTLSLMPDGTAGALLFAVQNASGNMITSVDINDTAGDDFAIAQLRAGGICCGPPTPEPDTLVLLGTGLLAALGAIRSRMMP